MLAVASHVKIGGAVYHGVSAVIEAIDGLAVVLTGHRDYFHGPGTNATEGQLRQPMRKPRGSEGRPHGGLGKIERAASMDARILFNVARAVCSGF